MIYRFTSPPYPTARSKLSKSSEPLLPIVRDLLLPLHYSKCNETYRAASQLKMITSTQGLPQTLRMGSLLLWPQFAHLTEVLCQMFSALLEGLVALTAHIHWPVLPRGPLRVGPALIHTPVPKGQHECFVRYIDTLHGLLVPSLHIGVVPYYACTYFSFLSASQCVDAPSSIPSHWQKKNIL